VRGIVRRLRDFSGPRLERAFFWAPRIQKVIRRRRWNQIARSGSGVLIDVEQLRPRLRQGLAHLSRSGKKCVGDYLEFGVFQGTSIICMWNVLKR
jgi:hypothetical protein